MELKIKNLYAAAFTSKGDCAVSVVVPEGTLIPLSIKRKILPTGDLLVVLTGDDAKAVLSEHKITIDWVPNTPDDASYTNESLLVVLPASSDGIVKHKCFINGVPASKDAAVRHFPAIKDYVKEV